MKHRENNKVERSQKSVFINTPVNNLLTNEERNLVNLISEILIKKTFHDAKKGSPLSSFQQRWPEQQ